MKFGDREKLLIYLPKLNPNSFLHLSVVGESTCLRDFSLGPLVPPISTYDYKLDEIEEFLVEPGAIKKETPSIGVKKTRFWYECISELNGSHGLPGSDNGLDQLRTLDKFQAELDPPLSRRDRDGVQAVLSKWIHNFSFIREKGSFNHWDHDDATDEKKKQSGLAWTADLLEHCRQDGRLVYVETSRPDIDFALVSMDLNLHISRLVSPIQRKSEKSERISPDGLGIRRDGGLSIIEVKAETDREDMFRAAIQCLCGALAVYAKREMILGIARQKTGKRPAAPHACIPEGTPSLDLLILAAANHYRSIDLQQKEALELIIEAWTPLRRVVFLQVDRTRNGFPKYLPTDLVLESQVSQAEGG